MDAFCTCAYIGSALIVPFSYVGVVAIALLTHRSAGPTLFWTLTADFRKLNGLKPLFAEWRCTSGVCEPLTDITVSPVVGVDSLRCTSPDES